MNPDVIVIGAGPVGLFTAIELKLLKPDLNIRILERNKQYTRHHILRIDKQTLINSECYKRYARVQALEGFVPTSVIENTFLTIAKELDIEIERDHYIEDANTLFTDYPTAHTIIGADGAHSKIRQQLFDNRKILDKNLQYIVEVKYQVKGATQPLKKSTYGFALGQVPYLVSENVGKMKKDHTPVSLFVFVDEKTYHAVRQKQNAKIADLNPNDPDMLPLLNTIQPWLALRSVSRREVMVADSEKINGVALNVYQSEIFAKEMNDKKVYLVGDAAAAVPYFRALNAGLIAAQTTAEAIAISEQPNLAELNAQLADLTTKEIKRAYKRNNQVNMGRGVNTFLFAASNVTTGAFLTAAEEEAMLDARVTRPPIFRRNPRITLGIIFFVLIAAALIPILIPLFPVITPALLIGFGAAFGAVVLFQVIMKLVDVIQQHYNPLETVPPVEPVPAFEWEDDEQIDHSPVKIARKLGLFAGSKREKDDAQPQPQDQHDVESANKTILDDGFEVDYVSTPTVNGPTIVA